MTPTTTTASPVKFFDRYKRLTVSERDALSREDLMALVTESVAEMERCVTAILEIYKESGAEWRIQVDGQTHVKVRVCGPADMLFALDATISALASSAMHLRNATKAAEPKP